MDWMGGAKTFIKAILKQLDMVGGAAQRGPWLYNVGPQLTLGGSEGV